MRYRFVDKIVDLEAGKNIHCQYTWPENLEIFQDHFPGFPVVPGVLLTEMMGQCSALCIESAHTDLASAMLIQIRNAIFRQWISPGVLLDIYADVLSEQAKLARVGVRTEVDSKLTASAELLFTFETKDKLGLPAVDPLLATYLAQSTV
jgi:3-hydroxyacyl-[acyl-carrier-protein] dehydratase